MIYRIDIEVVAPVYPTEDDDRVVAAIEAIFPNAEIDRHPGELIATAHSVDRFGELLAKQRIMETARATLLGGIEGDVVSFSLNKQAALANVVNFAIEDGAELGIIDVRIEVEQPTPQAFVEDFTAPASEPD